MFTENGFKFLKANRLLTESNVEVDLTPAGRVFLAHLYSQMEVSQDSVACTTEYLEAEYAYCSRGFRRAIKTLHDMGVIDYGQEGGRINTGNVFTKLAKTTLLGVNSTVAVLEGFEFEPVSIKVKTADIMDGRHYYVYMCQIDGVPAYVGMGKGSRVDHCTSGASHCRELNDAVIQGKDVKVLILFKNQTKEEALDRETTMIQGLTATGFALLNKKMSG